ncbi:tetratricopeptide repeat protein [Hydrogenimonas sp. SS33]|uniref:tetratricopeptide repeat protein n=1 Tax=Hydrogenimonas leucolamina TaxID=2954236 RepID=UPI00336BD191
MSRYLSIALLSLLLLGGCATKQPETTGSAGSYKSFDKEDAYIVEALYYKEHGDYAKAYTLFHTLYEKTANPVYRVEAVKLLIASKRYEEARKELEAMIAKDPKNLLLHRLAAVAQLKLGRMDDALKTAQKLVALEPDNAQNIDLLASIYLAKGDNDEAFEAYKSYYDRHHDAATVVKMASILYHKIKAPDEAVRLLETHSKMVGCDENVCLFLAELYRQKGELEHLADVYARLYTATKTPEYAQKAAEIYAFKKEYAKAVDLLKSSHADDRLLLAIYKHTKAFRKAAKLALNLYEENNDPVWLAEYSILLYEGATKKSDPALLKKVIQNLSKALKEGVNDPLYLNYLGYLLIDHDLDVKWGVELVKKALKAEPDSAYYIDSLAWGYYKLGQCKAAYVEMKRVVDKLGAKDPEIKKHWNAIQHCRSTKK